MPDAITEHDAEEILEKLARNGKPEDIQKIDHQFANKLARLEKDGKASRKMLDQLRVLWKMLKTPDDVVPFKSKAWIMAALTYFVSPIDLVPDALGVPGYMDDAMIVRIVFNRLGPDIEAFEKHQIEE